MKNKLFIQYKKERLTILSPFPLDRPNKVESLKCNSLERAKQIVTSRNHTNIKKALWYDGYGNKTKVEPQKTKLWKNLFKKSGKKLTNVGNNK